MLPHQTNQGQLRLHFSSQSSERRSNFLIPFIDNGLSQIGKLNQGDDQVRSQTDTLVKMRDEIERQEMLQFDEDVSKRVEWRKPMSQVFDNRREDEQQPQSPKSQEQKEDVVDDFPRSAERKSKSKSKGKGKRVINFIERPQHFKVSNFPSRQLTNTVSKLKQQLKSTIAQLNQTLEQTIQKYQVTKIIEAYRQLNQITTEKKLFLNKIHKYSVYGMELPKLNLFSQNDDKMKECFERLDSLQRRNCSLLLYGRDDSRMKCIMGNDNGQIGKNSNQEGAYKLKGWEFMKKDRVMMSEAFSSGYQSLRRQSRKDNSNSRSNSNSNSSKSKSRKKQPTLIDEAKQIFPSKQLSQHSNQFYNQLYFKKRLKKAMTPIPNENPTETKLMGTGNLGDFIEKEKKRIAKEQVKLYFQKKQELEKMLIKKNKILNGQDGQDEKTDQVQIQTHGTKRLLPKSHHPHLIKLNNLTPHPLTILQSKQKQQPKLNLIAQNMQVLFFLQDLTQDKNILNQNQLQQQNLSDVKIESISISMSKRLQNQQKSMKLANQKRVQFDKMNDQDKVQAGGNAVEMRMISSLMLRNDNTYESPNRSKHKFQNVPSVREWNLTQRTGRSPAKSSRLMKNSMHKSVTHTQLASHNDELLRQAIQLYHPQEQIDIMEYYSQGIEQKIARYVRENGGDMGTKKKNKKGLYVSKELRKGKALGMNQGEGLFAIPAENVVKEDSLEEVDSYPSSRVKPIHQFIMQSPNASNQQVWNQEQQQRQIKRIFNIKSQNSKQIKSPLKQQKQKQKSPLLQYISQCQQEEKMFKRLYNRGIIKQDGKSYNDNHLVIGSREWRNDEEKIEGNENQQERNKEQEKRKDKEQEKGKVNRKEQEKVKEKDLKMQVKGKVIIKKTISEDQLQEEDSEKQDQQIEEKLPTFSVPHEQPQLQQKPHKQKFNIFQAILQKKIEQKDNRKQQEKKQQVYYHKPQTKNKQESRSVPVIKPQIIPEIKPQTIPELNSQSHSDTKTLSHAQSSQEAPNSQQRIRIASFSIQHPRQQDKDVKEKQRKQENQKYLKEKQEKEKQEKEKREKQEKEKQEKRKEETLKSNQINQVTPSKQEVPEHKIDSRNIFFQKQKDSQQKLKLGQFSNIFDKVQIKNQLINNTNPHNPLAPQPQPVTAPPQFTSFNPQQFQDAFKSQENAKSFTSFQTGQNQNQKVFSQITQQLGQQFASMPTFESFGPAAFTNLQQSSQGNNISSSGGNRNIFNQPNIFTNSKPPTNIFASSNEPPKVFNGQNNPFNMLHQNLNSNPDNPFNQNQNQNRQQNNPPASVFSQSNQSNSSMNPFEQKNKMVNNNPFGRNNVENSQTSNIPPNYFQARK